MPPTGNTTVASPVMSAAVGLHRLYFLALQAEQGVPRREHPS